ncbi:MAG: trypsin-like peptidase domain-containing protein [Clostridia bacterium]|nr:trypsin-like peptidase domain-containing protein [Clostridia bacterium]
MERENEPIEQNENVTSPEDPAVLERTPDAGAAEEPAKDPESAGNAEEYAEGAGSAEGTVNAEECAEEAESAEGTANAEENAAEAESAEGTANAEECAAETALTNGKAETSPLPGETPACGSAPAEDAGTPSDGAPDGEKQEKRKSGKGVVALAIIAAVLALAVALLFNLVLTLNRRVEKLNDLTKKNEKTVDALIAAAEDPTTDRPVVIETDPKTVTVVTANDAVVKVAQQCSASVVTVRVTTSTGSGSGSGVVWSEDGYIVTNNHVVEDAVSVRVVFQNGKYYPGTVIATDPENDLALLRINKQGLTPVTPGSSEEIVVGETAVAIGNPLGTLANTVTDGIVSALARDIVVEGNEIHVMQISCAINPGNSGGGCFNAKGELIGIVNAKKYASGIEGLAFAIPVDTVKKVIGDMVENDHTTLRKSLGLTSVYEVNEENYGSFSSTYLARLEQLNGGKPIYGIYIYGDGQVNYVDENNTFLSGDIILSIDGQEIKNGDDIDALLETKNGGDVLTVKIKRLISSGFFSSKYTLEEKEIQIKVVMMFR